MRRGRYGGAGGGGRLSLGARRHVPTAPNLAVLDRSVPTATIEVLPEVHYALRRPSWHLSWPASRRTIAPEVLAVIADWIAALPDPAARAR